MHQDSIKFCYLDTDFLDRTTLKHITDYGYAPMLQYSKVQALLQ